MMHNVTIEHETDILGHDWKIVRIDGVLNSIFATCKHCDTVVKAVSPAKTKLYLRNHDCIDAHKELKSFVCVAINRFF